MYTSEINGITLELKTASCVFSPAQPDKGTLAMLKRADCHIRAGGDIKILDLGCGCGIVGIYAAKIIGAEKVFMSDISETAASITKENAEKNGVGGVTVIQSDGFRDMNESGFTLILCNPPYHENFSVPKHFIEKGFNRLILGGRLVMVVKRREWYKNKLISVFGGVQIEETDGYYVMISEKRSMKRG